MTHHLIPPKSPIDLRVGDTCDMASEVAGPTGRLYTRTPCCYSRVIIGHADVDWMLKRSATRGADTAYVTRNCRVCEWPYRIRVKDAAGLNLVEFEVREP